MIELPPAILHGEITPQCVQMVAGAYQHDPLLLVGILKAEGGRVGMKLQNKNKTYDYGVAQINSSWLPQLRGIGLGEHELMYDSCRNLWAAGWILRRCVDKHNGHVWRGVGCYHAGENARTPAQLQRLSNYSLSVQNYLSRSATLARQWLSGAYNANLVQYDYTNKAGRRSVKPVGITMTVN